MRLHSVIFTELLTLAHVQAVDTQATGQNLFCDCIDYLSDSPARDCLLSLSRTAVREKYSGREEEIEQLSLNLAELLYQARRLLPEEIIEEIRDVSTRDTDSTADTDRDANISIDNIKTRDSRKEQWHSITSLLTCIHFRNARLNFVPFKELEFFPEISRIDLSGMDFTDKDIKSIENLSSLKKLEILYLNENAFTRIPCLSQFENLRCLGMWGCPLVSLDVQTCTCPVMCSCPSLEEFNCNFSGARSIPPEFFDAFPGLKRLLLFGSKITDISMFNDQFFEKYRNIEVIDLTLCPVVKSGEELSVGNARKLLAASVFN